MPATRIILDPRMLAGVDEAGRGCLAGPVVAGAVILPGGYDLPGLGDSKALTEAKRQSLEPAIKSQALAGGLGVVWPADIDRVNILQATFRAMARALAVLRAAPLLVGVDGDKIIPSHLFPYPGVSQRAVIGGDAFVPAISAASVLAKTFRDRLMERLDARHPGYGFALHKGYGTKAHLEALARLGPCAQHRKTFRGVLPQAPQPRQEQQCLPGI